jgi:hypothetical protein
VDLLRLKRTITILMIMSHLVTFFWILVLYVFGGFAFDELTTAIALLMPLFAGFTTMIVKDTIAEAAPGAVAVQTRELPWSFGFLTLAFCGSFTAYLVLIVTLKGFNVGFSSFDQFKVLLGISETVFGVYIGYLMPILFTQGGHQPSRPPTDGGATKPPELEEESSGSPLDATARIASKATTRARKNSTK